MLRQYRRWYSSPRIVLTFIVCLMLTGSFHTTPVAYAATTIHFPAHDGFVRGGVNWETVYNTNALEVKNSPNTSGADDHRTYLKFNLSTINGTVTNATLKLYVEELPDGPVMITLTSAADTLSDAMAGTPWTEANLRRRYEPTRGGSITMVHIHNTGLITLNVTDQVQQEANGDDIVSFALLDEDPSDNKLVRITSKDKQGFARNAPTLTVTTGGEEDPPLLATPATGTNSGPFFQIPCLTSHLSQDDPIVYFGQNNATHQHEFFGNRTTDENSTLTSLLAAPQNSTGTTCTLDTKDTAAYWVPVLYDSAGNMHRPYRVRAYYYANSNAAQRANDLVTFPQGLKIIAGDALATGPQPEGAIRWLCRNKSSQAGEQELMFDPPTIQTPPQCRTDQYLSLMIRFPNCVARHSDGSPWLDSFDHRRHMAYAESGYACPASHPIRVPKLRLSITYEVNGGFSGGQFTIGGPAGSGYELPWYAMHADFFNSWDAAALQEYVNECLKSPAQSTDRPGSCNEVLNAPPPTP
jgi:hypothetical protein